MSSCTVVEDLNEELEPEGWHVVPVRLGAERGENWK